MSPLTPRMTTRLLPPPAPTTPNHDYTSNDRNDNFDAVHHNHAFDNDFDLDMHEPIKSILLGGVHDLTWSAYPSAWRARGKKICFCKNKYFLFLQEQIKGIIIR